MRIARGKIIKL